MKQCKQKQKDLKVLLSLLLGQLTFITIILRLKPANIFAHKHLSFKSIRTVLIINFKLLMMAVSTDFKLINMVMTINRWMSSMRAKIKVPWSSPWTSWWTVDHSWRRPWGPHGWRPHWLPHEWLRKWRPRPSGLQP